MYIEMQLRQDADLRGDYLSLLNASHYAVACYVKRMGIDGLMTSLRCMKDSRRRGQFIQTVLSAARDAVVAAS